MKLAPTRAVCNLSEWSSHAGGLNTYVRDFLEMCHGGGMNNLRCLLETCQASFVLMAECISFSSFLGVCSTLRQPQGIVRFLLREMTHRFFFIDDNFGLYLQALHFLGIAAFQ